MAPTRARSRGAWAKHDLCNVAPALYEDVLHDSVVLARRISAKREAVLGVDSELSRREELEDRARHDVVGRHFGCEPWEDVDVATAPDDRKAECVAQTLVEQDVPNLGDLDVSDADGNAD
jgi:hypothetical protein